jgi:hypothetical protein
LFEVEPTVVLDPFSAKAFEIAFEVPTLLMTDVPVPDVIDFAVNLLVPVDVAVAVGVCLSLEVAPLMRYIKISNSIKFLFISL